VVEAVTGRLRSRSSPDKELLADWVSDVVPSAKRVARLMPQPGSPIRSAWRRHDRQLGIRAHGPVATESRQSRHAPRCTCRWSHTRVFAWWRWQLDRQVPNW